MRACVWASLLLCVLANVSSTPCLPEEFTCARGGCVSEEHVCDFRENCEDGSDETNCSQFVRCDFEEGFCGFQLQNERHVWIRGSGLSRPSSETDHRENITGNCLYIHSKNGGVVTAEIYSPLFQPSQTCWLTFYRHIGKLSGALQVLIQFKSSGEMQEVWFQSTSNPDPHTLPWIRTVVVFNSREEFKVVIRGLIFSSSDQHEIVAIDDVSFSRGCVAAVETDIKVPLPTQCPASQFHCGANVCVDRVKVCDFSLECPNGEDEAKCSAQCDFESDSCGWHELIQGDGFEWVRDSTDGIAMEYKDQTPPQDHSTNTSAGHFMFIFKRSSRLSQQALLRSPTFQQTSSDCVMTFWHYNFGHSVGAAEMHLVIEGSDSITVLWQTLYNQGNQWHPETIQIGRQTRPFYISVAKMSLAVYEGVSALDDIMFHNCSMPEAVEMCPTPDHLHCSRSKACVDYYQICDLIDDCGDGTDEENCSPELMCDFENGLCSWTQEHEEDMFDWTRIQGPTPTFNTGPWKDHTRANVDGHYLYIESSEPQKFKDTAVLVSRPFLQTPRRGPESKPPCVFRFHYHMFGQHVFHLAVYIRTRNSGRGNLLWARYGDQGNFWHRKTLVINSAHHFQILVEGTVGDDFRGDIAIDDLSFLGCQPYDGELPSKEPSTLAPIPTFSTAPPHSCPPDQFVCLTTRECVSLNQVCNFTPDCSDSSDEEHCVKEYCDFEGDALCGWYLSVPAAPVPPHAFRWQTGQGESVHQGEENHRPANDHTLGSSEGWYIFADSSNGGYGHSTDLLTAPIKITGPQCTLVFWYHMSGFTVGTLQVFIKSRTVSHEVWSQTGNQGNSWMRAEVFIGIRHNIQVGFRAKRGISYMGDVVVDDVVFVDCAPPITSDLPCGINEFICANGHCISEDNLCDFIDHCGDGSDENHYICKGFSGRCNFEFDICSWRQSQDDDFDWLIKQGNMDTHGIGPSTDHTLRNPSGHYLYLEGSFPQATGHIARIVGPHFRHCSRECKMFFYVHMSGDGIGTLNVYLSTNSNRSLLLSLTGNQGNYWRRQELHISSADNFRIMFEGKVGHNTRVHICLDDITFTSGCILRSTFQTDADPRLLSGSCPVGSLPCNNGNCYKQEQKCDFIHDCGDGTDELDCGTSCSFEHGLCGWKSSLAGTFSWAHGVGSIHMTRPPHDHTLKNESGHFVYLAATPVGLKGDKAHMRSSVWKESSATCKLTFWYYISEKATGIIRLFIKTENELREVWTERQVQREWRRAEVSLKSLRNFNLIFEAVRTQDVSGGAALDDLQFVDCAPRAVDPGSCPAVTDFVCNNGDCIEYHLECDGKADCSDESDEIDCINVPGACNFDMPSGHWQETCQLSQDPYDDFDWDIGYGRMHNGTGPSADHSPNGRGGYLYVNSSAQRNGDIARLISQLEFPASVGICHLRFWFHMYGSSRVGALKVYTVGRSGTPLLMWATCGNHGDSWHYANVILSNVSPFRVIVQAEVGADQWTDIAVDDISFTRQCLVGGPVTSIPQTCHKEHFQCLLLFECIPVSWQCDGEVDCLDSSDEEMCASVVPGTMPPQTGCETGEYRCMNNSCIPALLRCDMVFDCPDGEDEYGCPVKNCDDGELVCEATADCVSYQSRCDNTVDCPPFNSDESSCYECPIGYCLSGGTCAVQANGPVCTCPSQWTGNRCHIKEKPFLTTASTTPVIPDSKLGNQIAVSVGLSVALILVVIATGAVLFYLFQRRHLLKDSSLIDNEELDCSTSDSQKKLPSPDVTAKWPVHPQLNISVYPWREDPEVSSSKKSKLSFSNPLYKCSNSSEA
ncbi:MAM and LDL-receptor class A domain-containing protein 1 [Labeo rohita]|uniref:MAM and LDL-receptor class A domain-containing protein 1 n=1 Tax=Labeo rohita TaxID=84645 RepID=UPI0021E244EC|nr:MAM and LDL-receptor class A domain-containing protein 1 [Labeo rohita]XP_050969616.1 MAM and LDL-receptor class A domain-containing protein 1 [Labeo rohita]